MQGALAYVLSRFPRLTETSVVRELLEVQRLGSSVDLHALVRERAPICHPESARIERAVQFVEPLSPRTLGRDAPRHQQDAGVRVEA